jgi:class 3 adenylate cyclase
VNSVSDIVVVLVVDMVESTSLRQRIGEQRFARISDEFVTATGRVVARQGGEMIHELGDGFMAAFGTASSALAAARGILQAAATANRRRHSTEHLDLRIGLSAGETQLDGPHLSGLAPVEATRLEAAASPNTILCSDLVRALARHDDDLSFADEGYLTLKGLRDPLRAWRHDWVPATTSGQLGLPETLESASRLPFVGRANELARLRASWQATREGRGRLVAITGEPGVGKTRLCSEFARSALEDGGIVLCGRCDQVVSYPYQPFAEALRRYARQASQLELLPAKAAAELALLVPELREYLPDIGEPVLADGDTQRYHLFEAIVEWLQFLAREDPVVLIIDDATWATSPTLAALHHIAARLGETAVLCVVTYRPHEAPHDLRDIVAGVTRLVPVDSIPLVGLSQPEVLAALSGLLGEDLGPDIEALGLSVWRESGGNPLYVGELFASLLDRGSIHLGERGWTVTAQPQGIAVPTLLGDVVLQRLHALAAPTQEMLHVASVAGVNFDLGVIRDVASQPAAAFAKSVDESEAAGVLRCTEGERYEFSHALVRDVLYDHQSAVQRAQAHEAIAGAMEAAYAGHVDDHADDLALHYSLAPSGDGAARGVWYAAVAAQRASKRFAYAEAVLHYTRAVETLGRARLADHDRVRCRLMVDLGIARHRAGDPEAAATLLEGSGLAATLGDAALCARAVLAGSRGMSSSTGSVDEARVAALRTALECAGTADSLVRARLLANLSMELSFTGDHREQDRLSDQAMAMARRLDDPAALVPVLSLRLVTLWRVDRVRERVALAAELEQLCRTYGPPQAVLQAATMGCQAAMEAGDFATADRHLAIIDHIAADLRQPLSLGYARLRQALRAALDGRLDESERLADEAYEYARASGQPDARAFWVGQRFYLRYQQGRLGEVTEDLAEAANAYPGIVAFRAAVAMVAAELGQFERARRALDAVFGPSGTGIPDDLNWLVTVAFSTQAAARLNDAELCGLLCEKLTPYRDQFVDNATTFWGSVERYLALALWCVGRHDDASAAIEKAAAAHARLDAPILLAMTRLDWATMLMGADQGGASTRDAAQLFGEALATAERLDLRTVARRARDGLARLGG